MYVFEPYSRLEVMIMQYRYTASLYEVAELLLIGCMDMIESHTMVRLPKHHISEVRHMYTRGCFGIWFGFGKNQVLSKEKRLMRYVKMMMNRFLKYY